MTHFIQNRIYFGEVSSHASADVHFIRFDWFCLYTQLLLSIQTALNAQAL